MVEFEHANFQIDITVLHARLFDHRPILQGHTSYFVKEFEERRGDRETARLEKTQDALNEINNEILPGMMTYLTDSLADIAQKASSSTQICRRICDSEVTTLGSFLQTQREKRKEAWSEFMKAQVEKSVAVDKEFEEQVSAVQKHYAELEKKLISSM